MTAISNPSRVILLSECFTNNSGGALPNSQFNMGYSWMYGYQAVSGIPRLQDGSYYHGKVENFAFVDGHVEALVPTQVFSPPPTVLWKVAPN